MGDLTKNLSRCEFACQCGCGYAVADYGLVMALQALVGAFKKHTGEKVTIEITSGCRCKTHNLKIGGALYSQHPMGIATDFKIWRKVNGRREQVQPDLVADILESWFPNSCGIGRYKNRTHFDTRPVKARWDHRLRDKILEGK